MTPRAHWRVYMQSALSQFDRGRWADGHTEAARIAANRVDDCHTKGGDSYHRGDVMEVPRLCQANALLAVTRSTTLRPDAPLHDLSVPPARPEPLLDALAFFESGKIVFPGERDCG